MAETYLSTYQSMTTTVVGTYINMVTYMYFVASVKFQQKFHRTELKFFCYQSQQYAVCTISNVELQFVHCHCNLRRVLLCLLYLKIIFMVYKLSILICVQCALFVFSYALHIAHLHELTSWDFNFYIRFLHFSSSA